MIHRAAVRPSRLFAADAAGERRRPYPRVLLMTHTVRDKQKLMARVGRVRGQVEAIEQALDAGAGCAKVMHLLASTRAAMSGADGRSRRGSRPDAPRRRRGKSGALNEEAVEQLLAIVRTYLK